MAFAMMQFTKHSHSPSQVLNLTISHGRESSRYVKFGRHDAGDERETDQRVLQDKRSDSLISKMMEKKARRSK
jgi:hypothetical protein